MVRTRSSHPLQPPPSAPGASNSPELADFLKSMVESMEVLRKQNEELNARLTAAEARSSEKERERVERREKERRDRVHRGKRPINPHQEDNESTVQGENEENRDKSRHVENHNGGSRGIGLDERGPLVRNLVVKDGKEKNLMQRGVKERGLIGQGNTETSLIMMSLGTASMT
jgi:hypothetical protein